VGDVPVGQRAANLPWLCPAVPSLLALTDERPDPSVLADDPAILLLLLRYTRPTPQPADPLFTAPSFSESVLPEAAAAFLASAAGGAIDAAKHDVRDVLQFAQLSARTAEEVARRTGLCPPSAAAAAALLAPLGWFLVAAVDPSAVAACRSAIAAGEDARQWQARVWGHDSSGIARRIGGRWKLPSWLTTVVANLGCSPDLASRLGADVGLFGVVSASVAACESVTVRLGLIRGAGATDDPKLARLAEKVARAASGSRTIRHGPSPQEQPSYSVPVLIRLLRAAARARRTEAVPRFARLQNELDRLGDELLRGEERFADRLRDAKLRALAELAAGAGHEINNPLAAISGNAQLLLLREPDPDARKGLEAIVRQTRRLSEIVSDLMHFARPKPPARRPFDMPAWVGTTLDSLRPVAFSKGIELTVVTDEPPVALFGDPDQLGKALVALVKNGIEAAGDGGWVRVTATTCGGTAAITVDDSGKGPSGTAAEHLFDPFYSGRFAGRGRGLGLSIAWRFARENGGDVRFAPAAGCPSRFVLEVPLLADGAGLLSERKSA
jgi:signal transduction histidine kinase